MKTAFALRFLLLFATSLQTTLWSQSSELYVPGLSILKLGASKTEVMRGIPSGYLVRQVDPHGGTSPVNPQSEANMEKADSSWWVLPVNDKGETSQASAVIFFSEGKLYGANRFCEPTDEPGALGLVKDLFALLKEETDSGRLQATVNTRTDDGGRLVTREIRFDIGGHFIILSTTEGKAGDGKQ
jgi:hypothetical protein